MERSVDIIYKTLVDVLISYGISDDAIAADPELRDCAEWTAERIFRL